MAIAALIIFAAFMAWIGFALHRRKEGPAGRARRDSPTADTDLSSVAYLNTGPAIPSSSDIGVAVAGATGTLDELPHNTWGESGATGDWSGSGGESGSGESGSGDFGGGDFGGGGDGGGGGGGD